ncbi:hypothetical protein Plhal304r1_c055g0140681 [Plasmopara halstedii]
MATRRLLDQAVYLYYFGMPTLFGSHSVHSSFTIGLPGLRYLQRFRSTSSLQSRG